MEVVDLTEIKREPIENRSSKGNQPKWFIDGVWYKADHMGYEALCEVLISRLLEKSNLGEFVEYEPVYIMYDEKQVAGCKSANFRSLDEMIIPIEKLHRAFYGKGLASTLAKIPDVEEKIKYTVSLIENNTEIENAGKYITALTEIDAFFLNEDRHTNNIAVIRNEKTKRFRLCPVFDNGLSLLSDLNDYPLEKDVYDCIDKVKSKPFSQDFDEQLDAAEKLYGQQIKFTFTKTDVTEILSEFQGIYSDEIIKRAETVLFNQMRKYAYLFSK